ncbi:MAG: alpha/beta fold hydrolase [Alphaproteobacteria bacterium]
MSEFMNINGVNIHYRITGPEDGIKVMFSNSLATNFSMWDPQVEAMAKDFRILCYDKRGHGQSETFDQEITIKDLADDAVALAQATGFERAHFCGLSIGGMTGQAIGIFHPQMFSSLALCATSSAVPEAALPMWEERIAKATAEGMEGMIEPTLARWLTEDTRQNNPDLVERVSQMIGGTSLKGYVGCSRAIMKLNYTAQLAQITTPSIVIPGEHDPALPVAMSEVIAANLPGSIMKVVSGAAHLCNIENPQMFNQILLDWIHSQEA